MVEKPVAEQIDDIIKQYGGWKADVLSKLRSIILETDPNIEEAVKWKMPTRPEGLPVWMYNGNICMLETFKNDQKLVFFKGAQMKDLQKHFNARLNSSTDRAIEFREDSKIDEDVIKKIVLEAVRLNS